jgi:hypothetical protein
MANALMLQPLPVVASRSSGGTITKGAPANLFNDYAGVVFERHCPDAGPYNITLTFDLGVDALVDTVMLFGLELLPAAATMVISHATAAQGDFTGSFSTEAAVPAYAGTIPLSSGKGVGLWAATAPFTARYLQVTLYGTAPGQSARVSRIVVGKRIQLARNFSFGAQFGVRDLGSLDFSARGVLLRRRAAKLRTVALTFSNIRKEEVEASTKPLLEQIGNTEMIALVTDPAEDDQRQSRCYFGPLVGDLSHVWRNAAAWEAKINLVSIF